MVLKYLRHMRVKAYSLSKDAIVKLTESHMKPTQFWCAGAETHGGDLQKQYETGNYSEVWFKEASIMVHEDAYSNDQYFANNDDYQKARPFDNPDEKK